jgi:Tol biopolymer transport system component
VPGQQDRNGTYDVFLRDAVTGTTLLVSRSLGSQVKTGNALSGSPVISGDGRYVAFITQANDLAPNQTSTSFFPEDLLLFDRITGASTVVVSSGSNPALSADGRYIAFISDDRNLVPGQIGSGSNTRNVFLYDRLAGTFQLVNHTDTSTTTAGEGNPGPPVLSADGRYTAFYTEELGRVFTVSLYDRDSGAITRIGPGQRPAMSADGRIIAYSNAGSPQIYDRVTQERSVVNASNRSNPILSADGRFITFLSDDDHLVPGQEGDIFSGLFLYDRISKAFTLVSRYQGSATAPREARSPTISGDGRFVAFVSTEPDLVPGQDNPRRFANVFLFERTSGKVTLVSRASVSASASGNSSSYDPLISTNGSRVGFFSVATDLEAGLRDFNEGEDVLVHEISSGTNLAVARRAPEKPSLSPFAESGGPVPSADGRWIAFTSFSSHLAPAQEDSNETSDVFLYDRATRTVLLVSRARRSTARAANGRSVRPAISADGRYVTYASKATNLVPGPAGPNQDYAVFQFDRITGQNRRVGRTGFTQEPEFGAIPDVSMSVSADGRWVAFTSLANDLVPGQQEPVTPFQTSDVFLWDRDTATTVLVSRSVAGPAVAGNGGSFGQRISADGRYVAFASGADDLVPGTPNEEPGQSFILRLFLFDRTTGGRVHVSRIDFVPQPQDTFSLSADGRFIAFLSPEAEVRLYDRALGAQQVIAPRGTSPRISADGRYVAFLSSDSGQGGLQILQVYLYERASQTRILASPSRTRGGPTNGTASYPEISADGRYVSFLSPGTDLVPGQVSARDPESFSKDAFLFDRVSNTTVLVNRLNGSPVTVTGGVRESVLNVPLFLSASGRQVAFTGSLDLVDGDLNLLPDAYVFSLDPPPPIPLTPCTLLDTRRRTDRPALTSNVQRTVAVRGACGVPATAKQVRVNVTVINPSGKGNLRFYPGAVTATPSGTLRFERNATRTETFTLPLSANGTFTILPLVAGNGTVHVAVEVTGYSL